MLDIQQDYENSKSFLFDKLLILETYVDGEYIPQKMYSSEWVELTNSPGVYMKNLSLWRPDSFVISLIHGTKDAKGSKHIVIDDLELHCITGRVIINGIEFKAHNVWRIPAGTEYNFQYMEDTYLTVKFIPKNTKNFTNYEPIIKKEDDRPHIPQKD